MFKIMRIFLNLILFIFFFPTFLCAADLSSSIKSALKKSSSKTTILVKELNSKKVIFEKNTSSSYKPASIQKILVSAYLLDKYGSDYTFDTKISYSKLSNGSLSDLMITGSGDPDLTIEDLYVIVRAIKQKGVRKISNIYLNDKNFIDPRKRTGIRAYEAGTSGLSFNYNSIRFEVCPTVSGKEARVTVDPWEYAVEKTGKITTTSSRKSTYYIDEKNHKKGKLPQSYYLKGQIPSSYPCMSIYRNVPDPAIYFGQVLRELLRNVGILISGKIYRGESPSSKKNLYTHKSKPLSYIVSKMNKYSNNFIADQLLYAAGKNTDNKYSYLTGRTNLTKWINKLGYENSEFYIVDSSGLSHENRMSSRIILAAMEKVNSNKKVSHEFISSLAVNGGTGTLKKRKGLSAKGMALRAKTGTISGVVSLAGMVESRNNKKYMFVIIQNKVRSVWDAREVENKIVNLLYAN